MVGVRDRLIDVCPPMLGIDETSTHELEDANTSEWNESTLLDDDVFIFVENELEGVGLTDGSLGETVAVG